MPNTVKLQQGEGRRPSSSPSRDPEPAERRYYNPDPLLRLIGDANESEIILEGRVVKALIDSGAQISTITDHFARELRLEVRDVGTLLNLEGTGEGRFLTPGMLKLI